jgi:AraC family transcriptional activator FtrA
MSRTAAFKTKGPLVVVLAYDGLCIFEFGIAFEVFGLDRPELGEQWYRYAVCGVDKGPLRAAGGLVLRPPPGRGALRRADLIIVPGWRGIDAPVPKDLIADLRRAHRRGARIMSLCSGITVLAAAGLLDGRRATTHWRYFEQVKNRNPSVHLQADVLYVDEGDVLTAAGSAAGIDLCLHVVRKQFGSKAANTVARRLVVPPHREGGQAQFVERPVAVEQDGARLGGLLDWVRRNLDKPHSIASLADKCGMSARTFQRRFRETTGIAPGEWLVTERVRLAQEQLERTGRRPLTRIAERCGFGSVETMRHHFRSKAGVSPASYRKRFASG